MESNSHNIAVYGFCFMPDHLHLVIATRLDYNLIDWIGGLKGKLTKLSWDFGYTGAIFQKRFYDHIIRDEANLLHHVKYVLDNPVRKNLENHRRIFPFVGSFIYDIEELTGAGG